MCVQAYRGNHLQAIVFLFTLYINELPCIIPFEQNKVNENDMYCEKNHSSRDQQQLSVT